MADNGNVITLYTDKNHTNAGYPRTVLSAVTGLDGETLQESLDEKQDVLVSGTSIKTVNSTSLLGAGDVAVQPTLVSGTNIKTVNSNSLLGSGDISVQPTLVSGTNIKTINSTSLLGSGNITLITYEEIS